MEEPMPHAAAEFVHTSTIVAAYLSKNRLAANEVPDVIRSIHAALTGLSSPALADTAAPKPAVPVKKSVTARYIVCLEDGKKLKMLKRYLRTQYNLTPEAYRAKWNLPHDYPMVAPEYAALRSVFAKKIGLGKRKPAPRPRKRT
jgi:predicted transcriptional regulator